MADQRLRACAGLLLAVALPLTSCEWDGNFTVLGYTTRPNYDTRIHTVCVPIFKNRTFYRGLEFDLTRAVVREIEAKTPYKVVSCPEDADSILTGTIISYNKNILNRNQLNEVREAETTLGVEVVWKSKSGEILSQPRLPGVPLSVPSLPSAAGPLDPPPAVPTSPAPPVPPVPPPGVPPAPGAPLPTPPVLVQSIAGFIPELGQSITTAQQVNVNRLAIQIVSMMEKPW
jgi:hypothetical protein